MFRLILIVGIIGFVVTILFVVFNGVIKNDQTDVVTPQPESNFPDSQEITDFPHENEDDSHVQHFEATPAEYDVVELPTSGLVTSLVRSNPSSEFQNVLSEIYIDIFWKVECQLPDGSKENAVILTAKHSNEPEGGDIDLARYAIRNWEPQIAYDLGQTLFSENQANFNSVVLDFDNYGTDSRYTVFTSGSKEYEIHYGWVLNFPIFAPSHECLIAAINDTYAPHSH
jgi:hypothetical protein